MDTFVESVVRKENTFLDKIYKFGSIIIAGLIIVLIFAFFWRFSSILASVIIFIVGYAEYIILGQFDVEYEYSITSDYIEISKIMARRRRKALVRMNMSDIAIIAPVTYSEHRTIKRAEMGKIISAVEDMDDDDNYYIIGRTAEVEGIKVKSAKINDKGLRGGIICLLYILPDEKIIEALKTYAKSKFKEE